MIEKIIGSLFLLIIIIIFIYYIIIIIISGYVEKFKKPYKSGIFLRLNDRIKNKIKRYSRKKHPLTYYSELLLKIIFTLALIYFIYVIWY